jgi:hypothetical protein
MNLTSGEANQEEFQAKKPSVMVFHLVRFRGRVNGGTNRAQNGGNDNAT